MVAICAWFENMALIWTTILIGRDFTEFYGTGIVMLEPVQSSLHYCIIITVTKVWGSTQIQGHGQASIYHWSYSVYIF